MSSVSAKSASPLSLSTLPVLWELCHPIYRGQLLQSHHLQQAHVPCSTFTAFILEAAFTCLPWLVWEPAHPQPPGLWQQGQAKPEESQVSSSKMCCLNSPGTGKHILVPHIKSGLQDKQQKCLPFNFQQ